MFTVQLTACELDLAIRADVNGPVWSLAWKARPPEPSYLGREMAEQHRPMDSAVLDRRRLHFLSQKTGSFAS